MTEDQLKEIEARAKAATPGPWYAADWQDDYGENLTTVECRTADVLGPEQSSIWPDGIRHHRIAETDCGESPIADAAHIAGMDPSTTLALVEEVRRLREALLTAEAWMSRWGQHVGSCRHRTESECTCGLTLALYEAMTALGEAGCE